MQYKMILSTGKNQKFLTQKGFSFVFIYLYLQRYNLQTENWILVEP